MNKRVIKYIQDNRLMLLIGITIAIGVSTVLLINSFIYRSKMQLDNYNQNQAIDVLN